MEVERNENSTVRSMFDMKLNKLDDESRAHGLAGSNDIPQAFNDLGDGEFKVAGCARFCGV
jgi:hypothetical protein